MEMKKTQVELDNLAEDGDKLETSEGVEEIVCSLDPVKPDPDETTCVEKSCGSERERKLATGLTVSSKEKYDHLSHLEKDLPLHEKVNDIAQDVKNRVTAEAERCLKEKGNTTIHRPPKIHKCDRCPYVTFNIGHLREHVKGRHDMVKDVICHECGMAFFRMQSLKAHVDCVHQNVKNHVCEKCGKAFKYKKELKDHINGYHLGIMHKCEMCNYKSVYISNVRAHLKKQHGIVRELPPRQYRPKIRLPPGGVFKNLKEEPLINHVTTEDGDSNGTEASTALGKASDKSVPDQTLRKCDRCPFETRYQSHLLEHIKGVHDKLRDQICDQCGASYIHKKDLTRHVKTVHLNIKDHVCEKCGKAYHSYKDMYKHCYNVHGEPPSKEKPKAHPNIKKCDLCPYETSFLSHLRAHVKAKHDNIKDYICPECGYAFAWRRDMRRHLRNIHHKQITDEGNVTRKPDIYKCEICPYETAYRKHLHDHAKTKHDNIKDIPCEECGSSFTTKANLNYHKQKMHKDKFKCKLCPYESCWQGNLIKHVKAMHENVRHPCPHCEYQATQSASLRAHIKRVHLNQKDHVCPTCNSAFPSKGELRRHNKVKHEKSTQVSCTDCGKFFPRIQELRIHTERVHLKLKNHNCGQCSSSFYSKAAFNIHVRAVHLKVKLRCSRCPFETGWPKELRRHIKNKHAGQQDCLDCGIKFENAVGLEKHLKTLEHANKSTKFECELSENLALVKAENCDPEEDEFMKQEFEDHALEDAAFVKQEENGPGNEEGIDDPDDPDQQLENLDHANSDLETSVNNLPDEISNNSEAGEYSEARETVKVEGGESEDVQSENENLLTKEKDEANTYVLEEGKKEETDKSPGSGEAQDDGEKGSEGEAQDDEEKVSEPVKNKNYKKWACQECGFQTRDLRRHIKRWHPDSTHIQKHKCQECKFESWEMEILNKHIESRHKNKKVHSCDDCGKQFPREEKLNKHIEYRHKNKVQSYSCDDCGKQFPRYEKLKIHRERVHQKLRNHLCDDCGSSFYAIRDLKRHKDSTHGCPIANPNLKCKECGISFEKKAELVLHDKKEHSRITTHTCDVCSSTFTTSRSLLRHKNFVHSELRARDHVCEECGKTFLQIEGLKRHRETVHLNIKKHVCKHCGVAYTTITNLKNHIRYIHEAPPGELRRGPGRPSGPKLGEGPSIKKYVCSFCGVGYTANQNLKKHLIRCHQVKSKEVLLGLHPHDVTTLLPKVVGDMLS